IRGAGRAEEPADEKDHGSLRDSELEEGRLVALRLDHVCNWEYRECRAGAESHRGQSRSQPAPIGEPLERVADACAVYGPCADATDDRAEIEQSQRVSGGV